MAKNVCVLCKHFYFDAGDAGYSEFTPGYEWSMECCCTKLPAEKRWHISGYNVTEKELRKTLLTANGCPEFVLTRDN